MPLTVYWHPLSPPSRAVHAVIKELGIDAEFQLIDLMAEEQKKPDFLKINPTGKVPAIDDGGFILNESRAIMVYLADKYGKNDRLSPKDLQQRAKLNSALYAESSVFPKMAAFFVPQMFRGEPAPEEATTALKAALDNMEKLLQPFFLGAEETLPDISLAHTLLNPIEMIGFDVSPWPKIKALIDRAQAKDYYFKLEKPDFSKK